MTEAVINNYIRNIASDLFIKKGSDQRVQIDSSVDTLIKNSFPNPTNVLKKNTSYKK